MTVYLGCCNGQSSALGQLPGGEYFSSGGYSYGGGFELGSDPFGGPSGGDPFQSSSGSFFGDLWGEVKDVLGDVAGDLVTDVKDWIERRIGREAWERMPDASKREAIAVAREELTSSTGVRAGLGMGAILLVGLALLLAQPKRRR